MFRCMVNYLLVPEYLHHNGLVGLVHVENHGQNKHSQIILKVSIGNIFLWISRTQGIIHGSWNYQ